MADRLAQLRAARTAPVKDRKPRGLIKAEPEHFRVLEVVDGGRVVQPCFETRISPASGHYTLFEMTKRGMPGEAAYREVAKQLGVDREMVSDQGLKDAQAVTAQQIVVEGDYTPTFNHDKIWLRQIRRTTSPLRHGGHDGNRFEIFVMTDAPAQPFHAEYRNFFGYQRFGSRNEIGELLLKGDFDAAGMVMSMERHGRQLRRLHERGLSWADALLHPSVRQSVAFRVNAFLSHLWNQLAKETDKKLLPMWSIEEAWRYEHLWSPEFVDEVVFEMVHQFRRQVWIKAQNQRAYREDGGVWHEFTLRSGSYATVFLANLYDLEDATNHKARGFMD